MMFYYRNDVLLSEFKQYYSSINSTLVMRLIVWVRSKYRYVGQYDGDETVLFHL